MELERKSSGVAKAGLTTGIIGTSLGALNALGSGAGLLSGLTGNGVVANAPIAGGCACNENMLVTRYELGLVQELQAKDLQISEKDTQIALRDAHTFTDQKNLEMYKYIDGRFREFEAQFANQAVQNQKTSDSVMMVNERIGCVKNELEEKICCESKERRCADNTIVNYANATFYPKQIADITTAATTTAQSLYNPLPIQIQGGCGCDC